MKYRVRFQRQLVPGQVIHAQPGAPLDVQDCSRCLLLWQPVHEVDIDIVESRRLRSSYRALDIVDTVDAPQ